MKPINTKYKGYLFRSRLEARWAVFFDALGLEWRYEPEGYDLRNGEFYLPDFMVKRACDFYTPPTMRWDFVEIKPTEPTAEEIRKMSLLTKSIYQDHYTDGGHGIILAGDPGRHDVYRFCGCQCCPDPTPSRFDMHRGVLWKHWAGEDSLTSKSVDHAATAARSARFEFADAEQKMAYQPNNTRGINGNYP